MSRKHTSDQRGIAHVLLIVLVVVVVGAIGFVGWKVVGNKSGTSNSAKPSGKAKAVASAAERTCLAKYKDKDLCKFVAAQTAVPFEKMSLKVTMTGTSSGTKGTWVLEQDGKGNDSMVLGSGGQTFNLVTYKGQSYMQTEPGGPWVTYGAASSSSSAATSEDDPSSGLEDFVKTMSTTSFTKIGKEACGKLDCLKYKIADKANPGATQYVWFDTDEYLMRQFYQSGIDGSSDNLTMTVSYQKVTIAKPSPVQDMSTPAAQ